MLGDIRSFPVDASSDSFHSPRRIRAADEEERFDFLRPVLSSLGDKKVATLHAESSRRTGASRRRPQSRGGLRKSWHEGRSALCDDDEVEGGVEDEETHGGIVSGSISLPSSTESTEALLRRGEGKGAGALLTRAGVSAEDRRASIGEGSSNGTGRSTCATGANAASAPSGSNAQVDIDDDYDNL